MIYQEMKMFKIYNSCLRLKNRLNEAKKANKDITESNEEGSIRE